nr:carbonic anhydrase family protein [Nitrospirillum iridis]
MWVNFPSLVVFLSANAQSEREDPMPYAKWTVARASALIVLLTGLGGTAACSVGPGHAPPTDNGRGASGTYGQTGTETPLCSTGDQQSPVDLTTAIPAQPGPIRYTYGAGAFTVVNDGHTIQADAAPGQSITVGQTRYALRQFHFHHPAEHTINGQRMAAELHEVFQNTTTGKDDYVVIGVLITPGQANPTLETVLRAAPTQPGGQPGMITLDPFLFLSSTNAYFQYEGSLTTSPCTQNVHWVVLQVPMRASQDQIDRLGVLFPPNARPLQPLNRRYILGTPSILN